MIHIFLQLFSINVIRLCIWDQTWYYLKFIIHSYISELRFSNIPFFIIFTFQHKYKSQREKYFVFLNGSCHNVLQVCFDKCYQSLSNLIWCLGPINPLPFCVNLSPYQTYRHSSLYVTPTPSNPSYQPIPIFTSEMGPTYQ